MMRAPELTEAVLAIVRGARPADLTRTEMGLLNHTVRADVASLGADGLILFELKSESDTLRRLPEQVRIYSAVAERCVLVVADRHLARARELIPAWWGLWSARIDALGFLTTTFLRVDEPNPSQDPPAVARLLWDNEVREEMRRLGLRPGKLRHRDKCAALAGAVSLSELRAIVHRRLAARRMGSGGFAP